MAQKVVVISKTESFLVKGLETKLSGVGVETYFAKARPFDIEQSKDKAEVFIYYMEEDISDTGAALDTLHKLCRENMKKVVIIGAKAEYDFALKTLSEDMVLDWFDRPLNMDHFLSKIGALLEFSQYEKKKKSVLIVDDDTTYMRLIRGWLKEEYQVSMANSGVQAITWLAQNEADLILLDYEMPVTSGPQVLEMLRSESATKDIPVMFLTGKGDKESIMKVLSLKPDGYLLKMIQRDELLQKLRDFFSKK